MLVMLLFIFALFILVSVVFIESVPNTYKKIEQDTSYGYESIIFIIIISIIGMVLLADKEFESKEISKSELDMMVEEYFRSFIK